MSRSCSVPLCSSNKRRNPEISFHCFPKLGKEKILIENKLGCKFLIDRHKAWKLKLKSDKPIGKHEKVCSLHFSDNDYFYKDANNKKKPYLKKIAVPSKQLPTEDNVEPDPRPKAAKLQRRKHIIKKVEQYQCGDLECQKNIYRKNSNSANVPYNTLICNRFTYGKTCVGETQTEMVQKTRNGILQKTFLDPGIENIKIVHEMIIIKDENHEIDEQLHTNVIIKHENFEREEQLHSEMIIKDENPEIKDPLYTKMIITDKNLEIKEPLFTKVIIKNENFENEQLNSQVKIENLEIEDPLYI